jgi:threonine/homoserine/homoserine lactone efflux protein
MNISNRARIIAGFAMLVIVGSSLIALRPKYQRRSELNPAASRWRRSLIGQAFVAAGKVE